MDKQFNFQEFHAIVATLRSENGCPWDRAQTHETLKGNVVEEAYEVNQAVSDLTATGDPSHLKEELGDLLLQVMLHSQIAEESGEFTLEDVIDGIARKMIHRHPHVFGGKSYDSIDQQKQDWERLKSQEEGHQYISPANELQEVPLAFPALIRGQKVMKKALKHDLIPSEDKDIMKEMLYTLIQLQMSVSQPIDEEKVSQALGKSLLATLKLAAKYKINAETALSKEVEDFIQSQSEK